MADTHELAYRTLGQIQAVVDMLNKPETYRMTPERGLDPIREIMTDYKLNQAVSRG